MDLGLISPVLAMGHRCVRSPEATERFIPEIIPKHSAQPVHRCSKPKSFDWFDSSLVIRDVVPATATSIARKQIKKTSGQFLPLVVASPQPGWEGGS